jgi:hypothetical protein
MSFALKDMVRFVNGLLNLREGYFILCAPQHALGLSISRSMKRILFFDPNFGQVLFDKDTERANLIQFLAKYGKITGYENFRYILLVM